MQHWRYRDVCRKGGSTHLAGSMLGRLLMLLLLRPLVSTSDDVAAPPAEGGPPCREAPEVIRTGDERMPAPKEALRRDEVVEVMVWLHDCGRASQGGASSEDVADDCPSHARYVEGAVFYLRGSGVRSLVGVEGLDTLERRLRPTSGKSKNQDLRPG